MPKLIHLVVGARPNLVKMAAVLRQLQTALNKGSMLTFRLIHTGQHYDDLLSSVFFEELELPMPDINLGIGTAVAGSGGQLAGIIHSYGAVLRQERPDMVVVCGDVTSTLGAAMAVKKTDRSIPLAHIEAGLRSGDLSMPEEHNRVITDMLSDYFFTTTVTAADNLLAEGLPAERIFHVGNTMIDTLLHFSDRLRRPSVWEEQGLQEGGYIVLTLHRHGNIHDTERLRSLLEQVSTAAGALPVIFPVHPHTARVLQEAGIRPSGMVSIAPLSYLEFNYLVRYARAVVTDSGGISEETTILNVPCMTLRSNTERPETCTIGTNRLMGEDYNRNIPLAFDGLRQGDWQQGRAPQLWDGNAAARIVAILNDLLLKEGQALPARYGLTES